MRLLVSALLLALFGLGSFWMWQEATGDEDDALAGVVLSQEVRSPEAVQPQTVSNEAQLPKAVSVAPGSLDAMTMVPEVATEVWGLVLGAAGKDPAAETGQEPAAPTSQAPAKASGSDKTSSGKGSSSTSSSSSSGKGSGKGEPEAVHRSPVDPDDDDDWDDDDDDDDDWDDD